MSSEGAPSRREALAQAIRLLQAAGLDSSRRDAEELLAHALGLDRRDLLLDMNPALDGPDAVAFHEMIGQRAGRMPLQQILGHWEFYSLPLVMASGVFIPRPETEILVGHVLKALEDDSPRGPLRGLELGTGSGAIALALLHENPRLRLWASDVLPAALDLARENARRLGLEDRLELELRSGLPEGDGEPVHLIVSNPPYVALHEKERLPVEVVEHDPPEALFGGEDGLDYYRELALKAPSRLLPGGLLALEFGETQASAVSDLMSQAGLERLEVFRDLAGRDRGLLARRPSA